MHFYVCVHLYKKNNKKQTNFGLPPWLFNPLLKHPISEAIAKFSYYMRQCNGSGTATASRLQQLLCSVASL